MFSNERFIEQLLLKSMPNMDDEAINLMIEDVKPVLEDWVFTHIVANLLDDELLEFTQLLDKKNKQEIQNYLDKKIPNYEQFIEKTYMDFEKMYIKEFQHKE